MSLENMKVTSLDKENYGIISVSDILDGTASENKEKFDRLPNFIADKHNEIVSFVEDNIYTKTQTNTAIDEKVKEIGSADMTKAVYATTTKEGYVDKSIVSDNGIYLNTQLLDVLTGEGENIKFFATDSNAYTAFKRNEIEYAVKQGEETEITLVTGVLYNGAIDKENKTINFTSGGAGLDITVIAQTERPATPKENTIRVISDLELNLKSYKIGYEYPTSPVQGDLFFKVDNLKSAYLYADKKQQAEISLKRCEYWDETSWVALDFETYANGEWHKSYIYLYYRGNNIASIQATTAGSGVTVQFLDESVRLAKTSSNSGASYVSKTISLTDVITINALVNKPASSGIARLIIRSGTTVVANAQYTSIGEGLMSLDVSALTGNYEIIVGYYATGETYDYYLLELYTT